jgi:hypothetical protein
VISIVTVVWLLLAGTYGGFLSFPVFFVPLLEEFQWSRALLAGAVSVSTIVQARPCRRSRGSWSIVWARDP